MSHRGNGVIQDDQERHGPGRRRKRRPGRRRRPRRIRAAAAVRIRPLTCLLAGLTLLLGAPLSVLATTDPRPDGGVVGSKPYCARDYERLHGNHYIAYNDDFGSYTCLQTKDQQHKANFTVTSWQQVSDRIGAFPNIFAGWEYGRHPANSWNPIADDMDGSPEAFVSLSAVPGGQYNATWDIWFNKTYPSNLYLHGQNDGAEIMVWLVNHTSLHPTATVEVGGRTWQFMSWMASNKSNGTRWHYVAFIAPRDLTHATLWLNQFFDAATAFGDLDPHWYMTSVSFGYELAFGDFKGLKVNDFAVNYVGVPGHGPDQHNPGKQPKPSPRQRSVKKQPPPEQEPGSISLPQIRDTRS
jgi:hypothetical protein